MTVFAKNKIEVLWEAQPGPQTSLIECPCFEVLFGGARGGGKTEASLGDWMEHQQTYGEHAVGVFFRRNRADLGEVIERAKFLFKRLGAKWNENKSMFTFPNGARLKFEYLERDQDAMNYQGHSYTRLYFEEVTQYPSPAPIMKLKATLRSAAGVPCGMRMTANPGGPGHAWVKARYIDPAPQGFKIIEEEETFELDGEKITVKIDRVFIPSKIKNNKLLLRNDPGYLLRLKSAGSEALVKAWLDGDWNIIDGAFFDEWDQAKHVLPTHQWLSRIPSGAPKFRAFDWGSAKPFSVGWYVVSDGTWGLPRGALLKFKEWYGKKAPNVGVKMDAVQVARGIVEREKEISGVVSAGYADPAIFIRNGGPSIAEDMAVGGVSWLPADNKRVPGWEQLHVRLKGENGSPMLYFLDCCEDSVRTIPILEHSETHPEDVDTDGEDHAGDETRYAVMSRPWLPDIKPEEALTYPKVPEQHTFNELLGMAQAARKRSEAANSLL